MNVSYIFSARTAAPRVLRWRVVAALALAVSLLLVGACGGPGGNFTWAAKHPSLSEPPPDYELGPADEIDVVVATHEELSGKYVVSPQGRFVQPLVGSLSVAGLTSVEAEKLVAGKLSAFVTQPKVSITLLVARPLRVTAIGEVKTPGHFSINRDETVLDVLGRAGGLTDFADDTAIFVVRRQPSERIRFRYQDLTRSDPTLRFRLQDGDGIVVE